MRQRTELQNLWRGRNEVDTPLGFWVQLPNAKGMYDELGLALLPLSSGSVNYQNTKVVVPLA